MSTAWNLAAKPKSNAAPIFSGPHIFHDFLFGTVKVAQAISASLVTDTNIPEVPITSISPGFVSLTGFESQIVLRLSILCMCGPHTNKTSKNRIITAHHKCKPCEVAILWHKKDGKPIWVYLYSCPMVPPDAATSRPCHHLNIITDVTSTRPSRVGKHIMGRVIGSGASGIVRVGKSTIGGGRKPQIHTTKLDWLLLEKTSSSKQSEILQSIQLVLQCGRWVCKVFNSLCLAPVDEIVAIKIVDCGKFRSIAEIEQIQDEISVLSTLKHPNIIRLLDVHFLDSVFYFIMEFASGGSLVGIYLCISIWFLFQNKPPS